MTPLPLPDWTEVLVSKTTTIRDALEVMGRGRRQIALVVDQNRKLLGTITDGDVRRGILNEVSLDQLVTMIMHQDPLTVSEDVLKSDQIRLMREKGIHHLPIVNPGGKVIELISMDDLLISEVSVKSNMAVLLVGGLGTRLRPLTEDTPKPLIPVGGRPVLETIVQQLRDHGIHQMLFAVNHMAEAIKKHFGNGEKFDVRIDYMEEKTPLGTAGPLGLLPKRPKQPFIVMNGDIITNIDFSGFLSHHTENSAVASVAMRTYETEVPYGVIENEGYRITDIAEKPKRRQQVSAGIYVFEPKVLDHINANQPLGMPDLLKKLIRSGDNVVGFPIHEYWVDIGRLEDLHRASSDFADVFS